ncbi:LysR family transcriptional regulator [Roseomonas sp. HJA6]|uniref:LysR family transcriptional regulator n=1 Tax=Roseomonas alba TaxID=2846776 RepID=A0ABS7A3W5_9PROT|nr:LysR family transcriptional regulator [Neoroseomonas alba]
MTLDQLRIFAAVAERQHVTQAAHALNLAQSAVSHAVAALESRYGTRLFDRIGRRIALTEAGQALLLEARIILAQAARAERVLSEYGSLERGTLAVHASQTIAGYWLPRHLVAFRRAHPGIAISLTIGNTAQVAAAIEAGLAELGFVEGLVESEALTSIRVARDQLVLIVAPDHPWAAMPALSPRDLLAGAWVLREPGSGTRSAFTQALEGLGIAPDDLRVVMELPSNEAVRAAVEAGLGATVLSASVAAAGIEAGLLHQVPLCLPDRAFHLLRHRQRPGSRVAEALIAALGH